MTRVPDGRKVIPLRQIGTLPKSTDPEVFRDHLLTLGMSSRVIESADGWGIWVHNEDHLAKARDEFGEYSANPDDPKFQSASEKARQVILENDRAERRYRKNVRILKGKWDNRNLQRKPLTTALMTICIVLYVIGNFSRAWDYRLEDWLFFFPLDTVAPPGNITAGLKSIQDGQIWRLITPIFLHLSLMHIIFNMWALWVEGSLIEIKRGTARLALMIFLSALVSNVGEYLYMVFIEHSFHGFAGISGVGYALFGYIWIKGRLAPEEGMILTPNSVILMLAWLVAGFIVPSLHLANGAHLMGLVVGMLFAMARL